ncbi:MAG: sensor histidine kinase [Chitinophagaceae bacterium]
MKQKLTSVIAHIAAWLFFFSLVLGFVYRMPEESGMQDRILSTSFLLFSFVYISIFYLNTFVLIPQLYLKKKYFFYMVTVLVLFTAVYTVRPFEKLVKRFPERGQRMEPPPAFQRLPDTPDRKPPEQRRRQPPPTDIVSIILFVAVWSLSTAICIIREWRRTESRVMQAEADKANAELSFLKAQINPHFLFNTLNNIYSLAITKNEHTAESIMKLSNIMRYVTDDVREDFVSLENEIECLRDYIDLQKLRLGRKMKVDFIVEGVVAGKKIAPLILMNFIENVFKYGISNHEPSDIVIRLSVQDNHIVFFCRNKLFETKHPSARTGIGLQNTRQRLQHLYPDKHFLNINTQNGFYIVQLTLQV